MQLMLPVTKNHCSACNTLYASDEYKIIISVRQVSLSINIRYIVHRKVNMDIPRVKMHSIDYLKPTIKQTAESLRDLYDLVITQ